MKSNVLVTGCSRGIGLAISKELIKRDMHVIGLSTKESPHLDDLSWHKCDISDGKDVNDFLANIDGTRLSGIVLNAGVCKRNDPTNYHEHMLVNFHAQMVMLSMLEKVIFDPRFAVNIIGIGSFLAVAGSLRMPAYATSKAAFQNGLLCKRLQYKNDKIPWKVNVIYPGRVNTDSNPKRPTLKYEKEYVEPDEVAPKIVDILLKPPDHFVIEL